MRSIWHTACPATKRHEQAMATPGSCAWVRPRTTMPRSPAIASATPARRAFVGTAFQRLSSNSAKVAAATGVDIQVPSLLKRPNPANWSVKRLL